MKLFKKNKKLKTKDLKSTDKDKLVSFLKSKGYTYTGWTKKKSGREKTVKLSPVQAMRVKMMRLKYIDSRTPKDYYPRNKWGIRWLEPEVRTESEIKRGVKPIK